MARAKLSATPSMSRAKLAIAYCEASFFSRSARRRVFSASAMARSARSFSSAISAFSAATSSLASPAASVCRGFAFGDVVFFVATHDVSFGKRSG